MPWALGCRQSFFLLLRTMLFCRCYEAGHAFLAATPRDLVDVVMDRKSYAVADEVREGYFRGNALANMKKELGRIQFGCISETAPELPV